MSPKVWAVGRAGRLGLAVLDVAVWAVIKLVNHFHLRRSTL